MYYLKVVSLGRKFCGKSPPHTIKKPLVVTDGVFLVFIIDCILFVHGAV